MEKRIVEIIPKPLNKEILLIQYNPFKFCNYHCPYCFQNIYDRTKINLKNIDLFFTNFDTMIETYKKQTNISISRSRITFIGGEVSLLDIDFVLKCLNHIKSKYSFYFFTNFQEKPQYYFKLYEYFDKKNVSGEIKISFHPSQISNENFISKLIELVKLTKNLHIKPIKISMVLNKTNHENIKQFISEYNNSDLLQKNFTVRFALDINYRNQKMIDDFSDITTKIKNLRENIICIYDDGSTLTYKDKTYLQIENDIDYDNVKNIRCIQELKHITINEIGDICLPCTYMYNSDEFETFGNIYKNEYKFKKDIDIICPKEKCSRIKCIRTEHIIFEYNK